jgi:hypothetical protein
MHTARKLSSRTTPVKSIIAVVAGMVCAQTTFPAEAHNYQTDTVVVQQTNAVEWKLADLNVRNTEGVIRVGDPRSIDGPHGKVVYFDGVDDGLFVDARPLEGLSRFTIEVLFQPEPKAPREQRFLHIGEATGNRLLLETRVTEDDQWYLDAFIKSGDSSRTLIEKKLQHPTGRWYHVALVVNGGEMETFVDGQPELSGNVGFTPFRGGQCSIGVRMNKVSWFKGSIAKIRITPTGLPPAEFLKQ